MNCFYDLTGQGFEEAQITFGVDLPTFDQTNVNALDDIFKDNLKPLCVAAHQLTRTVVVDSTGLTFESTNAPVAGTASGTGWSPQVCFLIRKVTAVGGRRNRGRWYLPGGSEGDVDTNGDIPAGALAVVNTNVNNFFSDITTADFGFCILHADGGAPTDIVDLVPSARCATQRRRLQR